MYFIYKLECQKINDIYFGHPELYDDTWARRGTRVVMWVYLFRYVSRLTEFFLHDVVAENLMTIYIEERETGRPPFH